MFFLRTSTRFSHPGLFEKYDKTVHDRLSYEFYVNFDDISSTPLALPADMDGVGVSSASFVTLSAFLDSAFGAIDFLGAIFSDTFEDVSFTNALEKWLVVTDEQESPFNGKSFFGLYWAVSGSNLHQLTIVGP